MSLQEFLSKRKKEIVKKWQDKIFSLYPADSNRFLVSESNQFANPVGHAIRDQTEKLYTELIQESTVTPEKIELIIDEVLRIFAIQDFTLSRALRYIYILKEIVGEELKSYPDPEKNLYDEQLAFYSKIDDVSLIAFDIYAKCREKLFEIKVQTAKNQMSGLLRRSDLICEIPEWQPAEN